MSDIKNRTFLGAIAAAIKALCMLIIDGVEVASEGVAMADVAVKTARKKQAIELAISMSDYATLTVAKASIDQAKAQEEMDDYVDAQGLDLTKKASRKKMVDEAKTRLTAIVAQEEARIEVERAQRRM